MDANLQTCMTALAAFENAVSQLPTYNPVQFNSVAIPLEAETRLNDVWPTFELLNAEEWSAVRSAAYAEVFCSASCVRPADGDAGGANTHCVVYSSCVLRFSD